MNIYIGLLAIEAVWEKENELPSDCPLTLNAVSAIAMWYLVKQRREEKNKYI